MEYWSDSCDVKAAAIWETSYLIYIFILKASCLVTDEENKKETFLCVLVGRFRAGSSLGLVASSEFLVRVKRQFSVSSRRPRRVCRGAPSSPSQAGSTTLQNWCSVKHKKSMKVHPNNSWLLKRCRDEKIDVTIQPVSLALPDSPQPLDNKYFKRYFVASSGLLDNDI